MKKVVDDIRLMTKISDMYYNQGINKQDIAKQLQISRPIVIRMLKSAVDLGIVDIHIHNLDLIQHWHLENQLQKQYSLKECIIIDEQPNSDALKQSLGKTACQYLDYNIKDQDTIGISMGSTLYYMINAMKPTKKDVTIVPLVGGQGSMANDLHSNSLAHVMAHRLSGQAIPLLAPARVANRHLLQGLLKEESITSVLTYGNHLDIAIVGIGYPNENESSIMATGYYKEHEVEELLSKKVVGEVNMQFYDIEGKTAPYKAYNNVVGVNIQKLRKVPLSIGIGGGTKKANAIKGAIAGKYINVLITDVSCAQELLKDES
ncbi:sugar-binding transcriptional regulator [Absicoccus porci]|uniref:Sugar-binding transcriptional regulator n=1 Tax=Absicoccus porci TaxID=2486576 RepID=A0A3N0HZD2_9FIRM|nr:sugar-binding domain-containing protein [Absicoccus porci]RNM30135.1 sugar-binding transcriptional regulator [Absicoccus porci]